MSSFLQKPLSLTYLIWLFLAFHFYPVKIVATKKMARLMIILFFIIYFHCVIGKNKAAESNARLVNVAIVTLDSAVF